jgi:phage replication-related protein YjqB (UPF0714/DUF867 family)
MPSGVRPAAAPIVSSIRLPAPASILSQARGGRPMADKYPNFAALARNEQAGVDYAVAVRMRRRAFALVAPHGGGIEPGTSEIAAAIAADAFSFYTLEGLKSSGNGDLHITSTRFDEPMCLTLIGRTDVVVTLHGEHSIEDGEAVFMGGRDDGLGTALWRELARHGFEVRKHPDSKLQGLEPANLCNRGTTKAGVQIELSRAVRRTMFESLTKSGRRHPTRRFGVFVRAVQRVLGAAS